MSTKTKTEVFIAGGGVAGLTLALKLAKHQIDVTVVEKQKGMGNVYKGELLQPKTLSIFEELEISTQINKEINPLQKIVTKEVDEKNRQLLEVVMDYSRLPIENNTAAMIPHNTLKEILLNEASRYPHFHLLQPAAFLRKEGTNEVVIEREGLESVIEANIIIGAEGRGSKVRKSVEIPLKQSTYTHQFLTVTFPSPPSLVDGEMIGNHERFLGLFPLPDGEVRSVLLIRGDEYKQMKKQGLEAFYEAYIQLKPELEGYVNQIKSWKDIQLMVPIRHTVTHYTEGNVVIIGDAAHSVHPMAGEGMNLAIQDAYVLGDLISWMYEVGLPSDYELLKWFEDVRGERVEYLSWLSHQSALIYNLRGHIPQKLRVLAIKRLALNKRLHDKQMMNIAGIGLWKFGLTDGLSAFGFGKRELSEKVLNKHMFNKKDDFPWRYKKKR
ncbi:NAD(P)/FAD-dependent oxidoreductase [Alkalihalophilus pseudofirmus]|uniref:NAD(P)/FAD-dependent oxidoreductase n=1 Tax=Alkalihalophilus pseudofirmus TaxID=79885 RepID=A0AAJ2KTY9_ALKPS|nr:NAD(P)/FAD-dependent oxidoreductase [Alkalihalophilus pseudofirmus]MDV2885086.1 NAD(P)/FAD-dependent oxidoreductase [Alkalihalophilus pseudofirmus]